MGYLGQDGILEGTEYDKYNFRINTTSSLLRDRLKISTNVAGYSGIKNDLVDGTGNTLYRIVAMSPMVNAKMEGYGWTELVLRQTPCARPAVSTRPKRGISAATSICNCHC